MSMQEEEVIDTPLAGVDVVLEGQKLRARQDAMQKKTFTNWYNSYLKSRDLHINDLFEDLKDGINLFNLLELISGEKVLPKIQPKPRFTAQKLENIQACLNYIQRKGIEISTIGSADIANGNPVLTLGMSWMLILRFEVQKFSADTQELLRWCKKRTQDYSNVKVENFTSSFQDGLAFNALIHKHFPELINYDALDPNDPIGNLNNAFDIAERELGVPKLLDAVDIASNPDEKSVITYVARLRQAFADREDAMRLAEEEDARKRALEDDAKRRAKEEADRLAAEEEARRRAEEARRRAEEEEMRKALEKQRAADDLRDSLPAFLDRLQHEKDTDAMIDAYNRQAKDLYDWIKDRDNRMKDEVKNDKLGDTLEEVQNKLDHIKDGVPEKEKEKLDLEGLDNDINTRLKLENRPRPNHEYPIDKINGAWNDGGNTEQGYKKALLDRLDQLKKLESSLERFRRMARKLKEWNAATTEVQNNTHVGSSVSECIELIAEHDRFSRDAKTQQKAFKDLQTFGKSLPKHPEIDSTLAELHRDFDPLPAKIKERHEALQKELLRQKNIETQRLKYFEDMRDLEDLLDNAEEHINNPLESDTEQSLNALAEAIKKLNNSIKLCDAPTPEEEAELSNARARVEYVLPGLDSKKKEIQNRATIKKQNEDQQRLFAKFASQFTAWYKKNSSLLSEDSTAEQLRMRAKNVQNNLPEGKGYIEQAESAERNLNTNESNPFTIETVPSMWSQYEHLKEWADARVQKMDQPLEVPDRQKIIKNLDIMTGNKGYIPVQQLEEQLPANQVDYLKQKMPERDGNIYYREFNPFPVEAPVVTRKPSNISTTTPPPTVGQQTPTSPSIPNTPSRSNLYSAPSATNKRASYASGSTGRSSGNLVSPAQRASQVEDDESNLPKFDDSMRRKKEIEEGVFLYTTQTSTSPLAVRYEVECTNNEGLEFTVSFDGSDNIKLIKPNNGTLTSKENVPSYQLKVVAIVQQVDPYKPASLKTKYSWISHA